MKAMRLGLTFARAVEAIRTNEEKEGGGGGRGMGRWKQERERRRGSGWQLRPLPDIGNVLKRKWNRGIEGSEREDDIPSLPVFGFAKEISITYPLTFAKLRDKANVAVCASSNSTQARLK